MGNLIAGFGFLFGSFCWMMADNKGLATLYMTVAALNFVVYVLNHS